MIINSLARKILCFGDSLTWGHHFGGNRFPIEKRWAYLLQERLGDGYDVIEEGLRSRTTNIIDPENPGRNGLEYFCPCFESVEPDILVLLLGTNDTKMKYKRNAQDILDALSKYIFYVQKNSKHTHIILMSPPKINVAALREDSSFDENSNKALSELAQLENNYCSQNNITFIDLSTQLVGNEHDGIHLELSDNKIISDLLFDKIHTIPS